LLEIVACITDVTQIPVVMSWFTGIVLNHSVELSSDISALYIVSYISSVYIRTQSDISAVFTVNKRVLSK